MLLQRVLSAAVLVPLVMAAAALGGPWFLGLVAIATMVATWEFYGLLRRAGYSPLWPVGLALALAFLLDPYLLPGKIAPAALALALTLSLAYLVVLQRLDLRIQDWAVSWVPPLYVGFLASFMIALRLLPSGAFWIYLVAAVTWATDVGAYLVGTSMGRRKFFSAVSPRKTQEGAVGGVVAGVGASVLLAWAFGWPTAPLAAFGLVGSVVAEVGDLAESLIKRQLQAKDASSLIPGHGGLLDRMDSLLFVGVLAYYWALWMGSLP